MFAHVDADSFFASVLIRKNPRLRGKPLLALGMGGAGFVIAATYEAKAKGVKTGMRLSDALKLCPEALRLPSDFRETGIASHEIEAVLMDTCPMIEQMSVDEWYMDLQSLAGGEPVNLMSWAQELRQKILKQTALSVSIGIAPTKLLAKMAGEYKKPAGITVLQNPETRNQKPETKNGATITINTFLQDRPAPSIPGIGPRRQIQTDARGWKTALDIATADTEILRKLFGKNGVEIQQELRGIVVSPVWDRNIPVPHPKSISRARSFRGTSDRSFLWAHLLRHLEYTVMKMRRDGLAARGITVWLRDQEYAFKSEHRKLPQAMDTEEQIRPYVEEIFTFLVGACHGMPLQRTQTGLILWDLQPRGSAQYSLFQNPENVERDEEVQRALDVLHTRYGRKSLTRAAALQVETGTRKELRWTDQNSSTLYS